MAASLEVVRQRITSPGQYPLPRSPHRKFTASGIAGAPQFGSHSRLVPVGFVGRHSWSAVSSQANNLLANRVQRLNLRLSPPTPGEEELCRHWIQNSAKLSKRNNDEKTITLATKYALKERPKTAQSLGRQYQDLMGRRAAKHKSNGRVRSPGREHMTSTESERLASPSTSHRTSPTISNSPPIVSRKMQKIPEERHLPTSTFGPAETRRHSPNIIEDNIDINRSPARPLSARPHEARLRNRARNSNNPPKVPSACTANTRGIPETRRWSPNEAVFNQQDPKDDDSAYSSSRDLTIHTDRAQAGSPGPPRSPPRSAPNPYPSDENPRTMASGRLSRARVQSSKIMVSGQDGRPVFYYHHNNKRSADDSQVPRHNAQDSGYTPLRRTERPLQRPVTQPAMGTKHSRRNYNRRMNDSQLLRQEMEERLKARALPASPENKKYPLSGVKSSAESDTNRQWTSIVTSQRTMKSLTEYLEPELLKRILEWLWKIEPNPKLYYGFETDIFGDTIRTSEST